MGEPTRVRKAFAYVTRDRELLVFTHRDVPLVEAGVQVPAGTVRDGESPEQAAAREVAEETGLQSVHFVAYLGTTDHDARPGRNEVHERHFFHLLADTDTSDRWLWHEQHDGLEPPTAFELFWIPLSQAHVLGAGMGAFVSAINPQ
jgi:8-oxo-dGTP pyrophosphatase MutT (NUDIX family)